VAALTALGWSAAILLFCAFVQLIVCFDGWLRDHGLGFLMVGDREYSVWTARLVQVLALAIGVFGLVKILST
jgi:hypothetical protein